MTQVAKREQQAAKYRPATDILEREDGFYVYVDMPGVRKEDMSIDLEDGDLTIRGTTSLVYGDKENFVTTQFGDSEYVRSIAISDIVDRDNIKANLENGVLELHLPKVEKVQPRKIEITQG